MMYPMYPMSRVLKISLFAVLIDFLTSFSIDPGPTLEEYVPESILIDFIIISFVHENFRSNIPFIAF